MKRLLIREMLELYPLDIVKPVRLACVFAYTIAQAAGFADIKQVVVRVEMPIENETVLAWHGVSLA